MWQDKKFFKYLNTFFISVLVTCFIIAVIQNYFTDGTIYIFGYKLTQFYRHVELRILPLLWVAFYLIKKTTHILKLNGNYYFSKAIISGLVALDAFTHTNGFYSASFEPPFYHRIWFDKIMHFNEGVILLLALQPILWDFCKKVPQFINPKKWSYWLSMGFISIFFVVWEILELGADMNYKGSRLITGTTDTNEDLFFAYLGFLVAFLILEIAYFVKRKLKK